MEAPMDLNYKTINIFNLLILSDGIVSLEELMQKDEMTKRILYYNIDKINSWLVEKKLTPLVIEDGFVNMQKEEIDLIKQELMKYDKIYYVLSSEERQALIYIMAALSPESITIEYLSSVLDISRNTVVAEITELKRKLTLNHIIMSSRPRQGYRLSGNESAIRYYIMDYLYSFEVEKAKSMAIDIIKAAVKSLCHIAITQELLAGISNIVESTEQHISGKFNNHSLTETSLYILVLYIRSQAGHFTDEDDAIRCFPEYVAAKLIIEQLNKFQIQIPWKEQHYIACILLGSKVYDFREDVNPQDDILTNLTWDIIDTFEAKACVSFDNRKALFMRLILHIKPMYYRLKYKIKVKNLFADEIYKKYREIYNLTDLTVKTIQNKYDLVIPDEEIAYICIYLGGWLRRNIMEMTDNLIKVLIVCNYGVGTSLLLKEQLTKLLGAGYQYDIKDERQFESSDILRYGLIVSTIPLSVHNDKIMIASPIITDGQEKKLLKWNIKEGQAAKGADLGQILEVVHKYASVHNESALITNIFKIIQGAKLENESEKRRLSQLLTPEFIKIVNDVSDEKKAIEIACESLIEGGIVTGDYAKSIIEILDDMGLYSELAKGVILAHGKPGETVNRLGISMTLFKTPVSFTKWNRKIYVIFTLAAPDNESHFYALKDLLVLLKNEKNYIKLINCDFLSVEDIHRFLTITLEATDD